ncbi:MAG: hypothetical protein WBL21_10325 [Salinimicrobium sp.]
MVSKDYPKLSIERQCGLLKLHRSGLYYKPQGESKLNLELIFRVQEISPLLKLCRLAEYGKGLYT